MPEPELYDWYVILLLISGSLCSLIILCCIKEYFIIEKDGEVKKYFHCDNTLIREKYTILNGKKEGIYELYYSNGTIDIRCKYVQGVLSGEYRSRDKICYYIDGKLHGECLNTYTKTKINYIDGKIDTYNEYYESSRLDNGDFQFNKLYKSYKYNNINGKRRIDEYKKYDKDGKLLLSRCYCDGKLKECHYYNDIICKIIYDGKITYNIIQKSFFCGGPQIICEKINGKYNGKYIELKDRYNNPVLYKICYYNNGLLHGEYIEYYENGGKIYIKSNYSNGLLDGEYIEYYENDKIHIKSNYSNGLLDGEYIEYYENDKIHIKSNYSNGLLNGKYLEFYENGKIHIKSNYSNDLLNGKYLEYYENGKIYIESNYLNGLLNDEYIEYNDKHQISKICNYLNGELHGTYKEYYNFHTNNPSYLEFYYVKGIRTNNVLTEIKC
jgi:uncharacterized protein